MKVLGRAVMGHADVVVTAPTFVAMVAGVSPLRHELVSARFDLPDGALTCDAATTAS